MTKQKGANKAACFIWAIFILLRFGHQGGTIPKEDRRFASEALPNYTVGVFSVSEKGIRRKRDQYFDKVPPCSTEPPCVLPQDRV